MQGQEHQFAQTTVQKAKQETGQTAPSSVCFLLSLLILHLHHFAVWFQLNSIMRSRNSVSVVRITKLLPVSLVFINIVSARWLGLGVRSEVKS